MQEEQTQRGEPIEWKDPGLRGKLGAPMRRIVSARGEMWIWWRPGMRAFVTAATGHGTAELGTPFLAELEKASALGACEVWDDWSRITSYEAALRVQITDWTRARPELAKNCHILVGSKLIAMGLSVANMLLGGVMDVRSDRAAFERALTAVL